MRCKQHRLTALQPPLGVTLPAARVASSGRQQSMLCCGMQASSHGGEEEGLLQVKLEYMAGPEMPEEGPGEPKLGRHLLLPLRLHLLPSLQVPAFPMALSLISLFPAPLTYLACAPIGPQPPFSLPQYKTRLALHPALQALALPFAQHSTPPPDSPTCHCLAPRPAAPCPPVHTARGLAQPCPWDCLDLGTALSVFLTWALSSH